MKKIKIQTEYIDSKWDVVDKINHELFKHGIEIKLVDKKEVYDDNRVYRTNERQLDTRIDGRGGRREAA